MNVYLELFQSIFENQVFRNGLQTVGIIWLAYLGSMLIYRFVGIVFNRVEKRSTSKSFAAKSKTIEYLLKSILNTIILVITILTILSQWGVDILPLLTGVGILGLGFSLGAQTLVKDLIAGFFILLENQYNIGDSIKTGTYEGEVKQLTLRLTVLTDKQGNTTYIPNSLITGVTRLVPKD